MATALKYSNGTRHAQNEGLIAYAGTGAKICLYQGTAPADANTAITTQTLLVTCIISGAFGTDTDGTLTLGTVTSGTAVTTGNAQFFRVFKSDGVTVVMDGSVGTTGADLNLNTTTINITQTVDITGGTIIRNNQ
jgi:hypothetical protein